MSFISHFLLVTFLSGIGLVCSRNSLPQQHASPNLVPVFLTARDRDGNVNSALTAADIRIIDDGKLQTIVSFERMTEQPISVAVLIDTSMSQVRLEQTAKLTARSFVESLMRQGKDEVAVVGITGKQTVAQELTTDIAKALRAIDHLHFATPASIGVGAILSGRTLPDRDVQATAASAIWDTIWNASEGLSASRAGARRVIFLLTDAQDTFSRRSLREAIESAQKQDVAIYAIGIGDKSFGEIRQGDLKKLAEDTGGRAFFPKQIPELQGVFSQLNEELHAPYLVKYAPTNRRARGEIQKLKIQLLNPGLGRLTLEYRRGYVSF